MTLGPCLLLVGIAVFLHCTESRQLVQRSWLGWRKCVLGNALNQVQQMKEVLESTVPKQGLPESQSTSMIETCTPVRNPSAASASGIDSRHRPRDPLAPSYEQVSEQTAVKYCSLKEGFHCKAKPMQDLHGRTAYSQSCLHSTAKEQHKFGTFGRLAIAHICAAGLGGLMYHILTSSGHHHNATINSGNTVAGEPCNSPQLQDFATLQADTSTPKPLQCPLESPSPDTLINDCQESMCAEVHDAGHPHSTASDSVATHDEASDRVLLEPMQALQTESQTITPGFEDPSVTLLQAAAENDAVLPQTPSCELHQSKLSTDNRSREQETACVTPEPSKGKFGVEEILASDRDTSAIKHQHSPGHTQCSKRRTSAMCTISRCHKKGGQKTFKGIQELNNVTSAHVWRPKSKFPLPKHAQPVSAAHSRLQGTKKDPARKGKNKKIGHIWHGEGAESIRTELKGSSRMPLLKTWDSEDFSAAERLGFSLREPVAMHGKLKDDGSKTNSWTTEGSGAVDTEVQDSLCHTHKSGRIHERSSSHNKDTLTLQGNKSGSTHAQKCKVQEAGCKRNGSNKPGFPEVKLSKRLCSREGSTTVCSHTKGSAQCKNNSSDPCTPTSSRRVSLLTRYCSEQREPKVHSKFDTQVNCGDGERGNGNDPGSFLKMRCSRTIGSMFFTPFGGLHGMLEAL